MNNLQWTAAVVLAFAIIFTFFRLWDRDTKGAFLIVLALIGVAAGLLVVSGCTVSPERQPYLEVGFAYDFQHTVGGNPACVVRARQPIHFGAIPPGALLLGVAHQSSCPDLRDRNTVDQIEVVAKIPLGRTP